jgi:RsiW-degrading membrane proteinase PrsW (M82 family)
MAAPGSRIYVRRGVWRASALTLLALLVFIAIVVGLDVIYQPRLTGLELVLAGTVLALVPAGLWLVLFYLQDRLEPEPKAEVARIFVIGLALAGAIGLPLVQQVFRLSEWQYRDLTATILGAIFIAGAVEAFILYATVRYFIYHSPQFNERTDGVIYGTAAGLGYAVALNVQFVLSSGGTAVGAGTVHMAGAALAHAAFGGVLGYFLGRAKLEREPIWWLPSGLLLTAVLIGLFNVLRSQAQTGRLLPGMVAHLPSFTGLLLAAVLALMAASIITWLIRRDTALALSGRRTAPPPDAAVGDRAANWAVISAFLVCLIVGSLVWDRTEHRMTAFDVDGFRGGYPAHFSLATRPNEILRAVDVLETQAQFVIHVVPDVQPAVLRSVISQLAAVRAGEYESYRVLDTQERQWRGRAALEHHFAGVESPTLELVLPHLVEGVDYIVADGNRAVVITMLASPETYAGVEPLFSRFLDTLSF